MWVVKLADRIEILANEPHHDLTAGLRGRYPGAEIYRSTTPCINEANRAIFYEKTLPGERVEAVKFVHDDDGAPVLKPDGTPETRIEESFTEPKVEIRQNAYVMTGDFFVVKDVSGQEVFRVEMELLDG